MMNPNLYGLPRYIGVCGNPNAGKSTLAELLCDNYAATLVDDGGPLRKIAIDYYGLTHDQVYTQEGKKQVVEILGRQWVVREFLGELGKRFENLVGPYAMPYMVANSLKDAGPFVFGSVRMQQGRFYKQHGGIVIEVTNPLAGPSPYDFDRYDRDVVDITIENDALARGLPHWEARLDLQNKLHAAISAWSTKH